MMIAAPAMAEDMAITVTAGPGDGTFVVSYVSTIAPRGVAFKVTVTGANITGSSAQNAAFNANIDYLYSNPGAGIGDGDALALDGGPGEFVPGPGTNVAIISAGVLDELGGQAAGPLSGDLITIETDLVGSAIVTVVADTLRSDTGAVGSTITTDFAAAENVSFDGGPDECFDDTHPDYPAWLAAGSPECWCNAHQCQGDGAGNLGGSDKGGWYYVGNLDLNILMLAWNVKEAPDGLGIDTIVGPSGIPGICADYARNLGGSDKGGWFHVGNFDLNRMMFNWNKKEVPDGPGLTEWYGNADCGGHVDPPVPGTI